MHKSWSMRVFCALVDTYHNPNIAADLGAFSAKWSECSAMNLLFVRKTKESVIVCFIWPRDVLEEEWMSYEEFFEDLQEVLAGTCFWDEVDGSPFDSAPFVDAILFGPGPDSETDNADIRTNASTGVDFTSVNRTSVLLWQRAQKDYDKETDDERIPLTHL